MLRWPLLVFLCVPIGSGSVWAPLKREWLYPLCTFSESSPECVSLSQMRCSSPLITFVTLCGTLSSMSTSFLYLRVQKWPQYRRCGLTSAEWRGRITSCHLLAAILLMHSRIPLTFLRDKPLVTWKQCPWRLFLTGQRLNHSWVWVWSWGQRRPPVTGASNQPVLEMWQEHVSRSLGKWSQ